MSVDEAQRAYDEAVEAFAAAFEFCQAVAGDPPSHAHAIVEVFGPAHRKLLEAGAALLEAGRRTK